MSYGSRQAYKQTKFSTASQKSLIIMLYDGAIDSISRAIKIFDSGETHKEEEIHKNLVKALNIITELMTSLDMEKGGEIAQTLFNLYEYFSHEVMQANVKKEKKNLENILNFLKELKEAWSKINEAVPEQQAPKQGIEIIT